jgi:predicted anti-sigma-YlaC factor YlaD
MKDLKLLPYECPDPDLLAVYLDGELTSAERSLVETHLSTCAHCRCIIATAIRSEETILSPSHTEES